MAADPGGSMEYRLLGPLEVVTEEGDAIAVPAPKRRALLAALLLEANRPVSPARLSEALWGDDPPPAAEASLQAHVSRLRRELGADRVVTQPGGYLVRAAVGELDVRSFEHELAAATRAAGLSRWDEAADGFRRALDLWRGPALADIPCSGYLGPAGARLEELRLTATESRIDADLELGRHADLTAELAALVREHPLRERLWRQLMLALYRSGRQADALAAYRRLRLALVEELGIDPSPDIQRLEGRILRQDPTLDGPGPGPILPLHRLPVPSTSLVGRRDELDRAVATLRVHRLLTLTGPGGVGKTRLAILVAHALLADFPDGVLFVDLSNTRVAAEVIARIGEATGGGERPAAVIGDRRILLVLDNFEQVVDAAPSIAELLERCPSLHILVTSRTPLRIRGERQLDVPPLPRAAGIALFEDRSRAGLYSVESDEAVLDDIVGRLDGLPLAIELAAAHVRVLSAEALRDRLADRLTLLTAGPRDAPERHRTLRETIAWSYDLLSTSARSAFRALSIPAAGFDLAAAEAIGATDLETIAELVDQSLLRRADDRYSMLETIREFAAERAGVEGETSAARDRHLAHYVAVAGSTRRGTTEGGNMAGNAWVVMCMTERDNLRLAFDWAVASDDADAILLLFRATGMFWMMVGAVDEGQRWGEAAIAAARRLGDPAKLRQPLAALSEYPRFSGDAEQALRLKAEALELARAAGDHHDIATILDDMASIHAGRGDFATAHSLLAEALAIHDAFPAEDPLSRAHTVVTLVELALDEGDVATALHYIKELEVLEAAAELFPDWIVDSDSLRAKVLHAAGQDDEAGPMFRGVVRDAADIGFRIGIVDALDSLATIERERDPVQAARLVGMADRLRAEARLRIWAPAEYERTVETLGAALGADVFDRLRAEGHALRLPAIVELVAGPRLADRVEGLPAPVGSVDG
ncbi:MAG: BTAD domain-containing putative transcriptional regulator [Chloroflexota bacterium]